MDDLVLSLAIRCLTAEDAFAASCVSREWRATLAAERYNGDLWKQVCCNSYPCVAVNVPNDSSMDVRSLVLGLWRGEKTSTPIKRKTVYTPTLGLEDIFAVVELYKKTRVADGKKRKHSAYSWICPISCPNLICKEMGVQDENLVWKAPNPLSSAEGTAEFQDAQELTPFSFAFRTIAVCDPSSQYLDYDRVFRVNVTLFRRDNMKSVRVLYDATLDEWDSDSMDDECLYNEDHQNISFATSDAGKTARSMMYGAGFTNVAATASITLSPKIPASGSDEEPEWLVNCRHSRQQVQPYIPRGADRAALKNISGFDFVLKSLGVSLRLVMKDCTRRQYFGDENDLMVALEGLCWE